MAYTPLTFVAGEILTATKMNLMSANDASFHDGTGIDNDVILSRHIKWSEIKHWAPDYANTDKTNIFKTGSQTITRNGWVSFYMFCWSPTYKDRLVLVKINDEEVAQIGSVYWDDNHMHTADIGGMVQVSEGDILSFESHGVIENTAWAHFIPGKWV